MPGEDRARSRGQRAAAAAATSDARRSTPPAAARSRGRRAAARGRRTRRRAAARRAGRRPRRRAGWRPARRPRRPRRRRAGRPLVSWRSRSTPASLSTPDAATCSTSAGTPITERGSGRSAPLVQTEDEEVAGWTTSSPSVPREVDALGPARQHRLGAEVDPDPRDLAGEQLAADAGRALEDEHLATGRGQVAGGGQARDAGRRPRRCGAAGRACAQPVTRAPLVEEVASATVSKPRNQADAPAVVRPCAPLASSRSRPPPCCSPSRPARAGPTTSATPPPMVAATQCGRGCRRSATARPRRRRGAGRRGGRA